MIKIYDDSSVRYAARMFGISQEKLIKIIKIVGGNPRSVKMYLKAHPPEPYELTRKHR